jgi:hypothetical protein
MSMIFLQYNTLIGRASAESIAASEDARLLVIGPRNLRISAWRKAGAISLKSPR